MESISNKFDIARHEHAFNKLVTTIENPNYLITHKAQFGKFSTKGYLQTIKKPSAVCVDKSKWLRFNAKAIKYLIFDIDNRERRSVLKWHSERFKDCYSWFIDTDKGCQLCFALKDPIPPSGGTKKTKAFLRAIKTKIIDDLQADKNGSMRNSGFWRNPLLHSGVLSLENEYTLTELAEIFEVPNPFKEKYENAKKWQSQTVEPLHGRVKNFNLGMRNNSLYWRSVEQINATPSIDEQSLGDWAVLVNAGLDNPLSEAEAHKTGRSAWRQYHEKGKRLFRKPLDALNWKREYNRKQYAQKRGIEKELIMTRTEAARYASDLKKRKNMDAVFKAADSLSAKSEKITAVKIAEITGISRQTVSKHLKHWAPF